ncbi:MAG: isochorismatase family protein [Anaerolineae bacterium]|nr:isochorismatase family protein [Anaerolineae bacterium]
MAADLRLTFRQQTPKTTGRTGWCVHEFEAIWPAGQTAFVVVDMWDTHWSWGATERVNVLAPRMDAVLKAARKKGVLIVHAPSDTMDFYRGHPAREWVLSLPLAELPAPAEHDDPPLPIDDSDHGSDTGEPTWSRPWTRQHPAIEIAEGDAISADGQELYNIVAARGIRNVIYAGVHTNMCVLNRPFAIKQAVRWGLNVALARDLTDTMYNPMRPPYVSHEEGTALVIGYIEKFWCPTFTSDDLTAERMRQ